MSEITDSIAGPKRMPFNPDRVSDRLRSNNFDGLRLIFASMVVVFHIGILSQAPLLSGFHRYISSLAAVQAFFFVSGFLVTMSYENCSSLVIYAKKRFFRIAPAYLLVIFASAILLVLMSDLSPLDYFASPGWRSYLFSNLILSNFAHPSLPGVFQDSWESTVNGSLWTIKVEVMFYCLVPFIVLAVRKFGYKPVLSLLFVGSLVWHCGLVYVGEVTDKGIFAKLAKQLPGQLSFFAAGAFAYYRTREGLPPPPGWVALAAAVVYALSDGITSIFVAPFCIGAIVYWAAIGVRELWSARRMGDVSYGIYLYHFPIAQTLIALGVFRSHPLLAFALTCGATFVLAVLSWRLVEKPALRFAHSVRPKDQPA